MGLVGALILVFTIIVRPQEFIPGLAALSLLNVSTAIAVLGIVYDVATGKTRSLWSPQLPWLIGFVIWAYVATIANGDADAVMHTSTTMMFSVIFMLVVGFAARSIRGVKAIATLLVATATLVSAVGIAQALTEFECIEIDEEEFQSEGGDRTVGQPTGNPCVITARECWSEDGEKRNFLCERPGPFGTFTIGHGRIRWRGVLADPNEMSLAVSAAFAFMFAFIRLKRSKVRYLVFGLVGALTLACVIRSQSRGGILVLGTVFGVYFIRVFGLKGMFASIAAGSPLILLGGRGGEEATSSTLERIGALGEGIDMTRESPLFGVGQGRFVEHYFITAHNSYLLSAAELGLPGFFLWSMLIFVSLKIPFSIMRSDDEDLPADLRALSVAILASLASICVGITFLSLSYHAVLFVYLGLVAALYGAARSYSRDFNVRIAGRDIFIVAAFDVTVLAAIFVYTRLKS